MASLKLMFLATLLLVALVGTSSAKKCQTNKDCPPCDVGESYCVAGQCGCFDAVANVAPSRKCKSDNDCKSLINICDDRPCKIVCAATGVCACEC